MSDEHEAIARILRAAAQATHLDLTQNQPWLQEKTETVEFHIGDDPIDADADAQHVFADAVFTHPECDDVRIKAVIGEEEEHPQSAIDIGDRVIVVDPLDGSKPWAIARIGFAVAGICLRKIGATEWAIDGAIIATSTDVFTLYGERDLRCGSLWREASTDVSWQSATPENLLFPPTLATVGYKPEDRKRSTPIFEQLADWSIVTLGGNPLTPYVVTGALTATMTTRRSTTWDTLGVLMASATDAVVGTIDGVVLGGDFRQLFAQVTISGANASPIPELIVAKTLARYLELVDAVKRANFDPEVNNHIEP